VRKEITLPPMKDSLIALRSSDEGSKAVGDRQPSRRWASAPMPRIRRVGEGRKRYR
jgi:hypothetical protein